jgi:hypothetical protein
MNYYYHPETREFLFENKEKIDNYPSTKIDIHFNLPKNRNQVFNDDKWYVVNDYRKSNVYKKNSVIKVFKKLGEKIEDDEVIYENPNFIPKLKVEKTLDNIKNDLIITINSFLAKTDKYFNNHPPKYNGDIEKLKKYREYLYDFTKKENWWNNKIISIEEWK